MKKVNFLFFILFLQLTLIGQEWNFITLPSEIDGMAGVGQLIDFSKTENGYNALIVFEEPMIVSKTGEAFTGYLVIDMNFNEKFISDGNHSIKIVESPFMSFAEFTVKNTTRTYSANQEDVITYAEALTKHPALQLSDLTEDISQITTIDNYYQSKMEMSLLGNVRGFNRISYKQGEPMAAPEPQSGKKKKKKLGGMMNKLAEKALALEGKVHKRTAYKSSIPNYNIEDEIALDWSGSYNGGQSKKAQWIVIKEFSCMKTGKLLAYNVHVGKETKGIKKDQEIVLFNREGESLKRLHLETEQNWNKADAFAHFSHNNEISQLEYVVFLNTQTGGKSKKNPDADSEVYRVHLVDLLEDNMKEFEFRVADWQHEILSVQTHGNNSFSAIIKTGNRINKAFKFVHYSSSNMLEIDGDDFQSKLPEKINLKHYDFVNANFDAQGNGSILFSEVDDKKKLILFELGQEGIAEVTVFRAEIGKRNNPLNVRHNLLMIDNRKILTLNYLVKGKPEEGITETTLIDLTGNEPIHLLQHPDDISFINYTSGFAFPKDVNVFDVSENLYFLGRRNTKKGLRNGILTNRSRE